MQRKAKEGRDEAQRQTLRKSAFQALAWRVRGGAEIARASLEPEQAGPMTAKTRDEVVD